MREFIQFIETLVKERPLLSLPLVFISGALMSFTPCFYPLIPVILGIIGVDKDTSKRKAFFLSLSFAFGLAVVYTLLGMISALGGSIFGESIKVSIFQFIAAAVFLFMGLALFDVVHINLNLPLRFRSKRVGYLNAFILGLLGALVAGGCTFPVLGSILTLIAFTKNVVTGGLLLFVFSLGLGTIFVLAAVFGSQIFSVFKDNPVWRSRIKKIFGLGLILLSIYFLMKGVWLL
ncbi:cytochrome c biogenesis protein CcdA [Candidatus Omnitrophota bacterium]